jgi:hypothetical protein
MDAGPTVTITGAVEIGVAGVYPTEIKAAHLSLITTRTR